MIYYKKRYQLIYFIDEKGREPVRNFIDSLIEKEQAKVFAYLELLREKNGYLDQPYSKHIKGKIRELRIDFARRKYRIFYFIFTLKRIILLSAFKKKSQKIPKREIKTAISNYNYFLKQNYEQL
jgi:phage-related protein